jgi:hypothetical protein
VSGSWQEATAEVEARLDYLLVAVQGGMPESWDDDAAAESLVIDYVRTLERRVLALGGSLERVPEDADGAPLPDAGTSPQAYAAAVRRGPELTDRRQRAREAFWDASAGLMSGAGDGVEAAIEVATRVRITPEIIEAARAGWLAASTDRASWTEEPGPRQVGRLEAAFRAAGFEVEQ